MKQWRSPGTEQQSAGASANLPAPGHSNTAYRRYGGIPSPLLQAKASKQAGGAQPAATNAGAGAQEQTAAPATKPSGAKATATSGQQTSNSGQQAAIIYLQLSGADYRIDGGKLFSGDTELGTISDASSVADSIARKRKPSLPDNITFSPGENAAGPLQAGNILSQATEGSTIRGGKNVWVRSEEQWHHMEGHNQITKGERKGEYAGFAKYGGGKVTTVLTRLTNEGKLDLTAEQIAILDAIAQVETGGQISCVQTYDDQVVSVGFKQVVLGHGSLEKLMNSAPAGFAKHGLRLDTAKKYKKQKTWSKAPHQIKGCEDAEELRQPEWAIKFYHAGLEPDVIEGQCKLALSELGLVQRTAKKKAKGVSYFQDPTAEAWLLETRNNRPAFMPKAISKAVADGADKAADRDKFLDILSQAIIDTYVEEEPLIAYQKAKKQKGALTAEEDAELLAHYKEKLEPVGRRKGTNIVTKIPRTLTLPTLNTTGSSGTVAKAEPAEQPAAASSSSSSSTNDKTVPQAADNNLTAGASNEETRADTAAGAGKAHGLTSVPQCEYWPEPIPFITTASKLRIRAQPHTGNEAGILGHFTRGTQIAAHGKEGEWLIVEYRGQWGYVHGEYTQSAELNHDVPAADEDVTAQPTTHDSDSASMTGDMFGWLTDLLASADQETH